MKLITGKIFSKHLLPVVIFFCITFTLRAEKRLFVGIEEELTYDSNIYLTTQYEDDYILRTNPNIAFKSSGRRFSIGLFYSFFYYDYFKNSSLDEYFHNFKLESELKLFRGLETGVFYDYRLVPLEIGLPVSSPTNLVAQSFLRTVSKYKIDFSPRTTVDTGIEWSMVNYPGREVRSDYWELKFPVELNQKLDRLMSAGLGYTLLIRAFNADEFLDYFLHHATIDANFKLKKLQFSSSLGYEWLDFKNAGANSGPIIAFDVKYDWSKRLSLHGGYSYSYSSDSRGNPFRGQHGEGGLEYKLTERVELLPLLNFYWYKMPGYDYKIRTIETGTSINFKPSKFINFSIDYLYNYNVRKYLTESEKNIFDVHRAGMLVKIVI